MSSVVVTHCCSCCDDFLASSRSPIISVSWSHEKVYEHNSESDESFVFVETEVSIISIASDNAKGTRTYVTCV